MREKSMHQVNILTFGMLLCELKRLAKHQIRSQVGVFMALFSSYCKFRGEVDGFAWEPSQGSVSRLFQDKQAPSWYQYNYYINCNHGHIRDDVDQYLHTVVTTAKQRRLHLEQISLLVEQSQNLDPEDKVYILKYEEVGEENALGELLYRALYILYREPLNE